MQARANGESSYTFASLPLQPTVLSHYTYHNYCCSSYSCNHVRITFRSSSRKHSPAGLDCQLSLTSTNASPSQKINRLHFTYERAPQRGWSHQSSHTLTTERLTDQTTDKRWRMPCLVYYVYILVSGSLWVLTTLPAPTLVPHPACGACLIHSTHIPHHNYTLSAAIFLSLYSFCRGPSLCGLGSSIKHDDCPLSSVAAVFWSALESIINPRAHTHFGRAEFVVVSCVCV